MKKKFKTMSKRTLAIVLTLVMLLTAVPIVGFTAFAATSGDYEYEVLEDGTARITKYNGTETNVTIPAEIDGYKVTVIGDSAFSFKMNLISVIIPNGLTHLGTKSFVGCRNLKKVVIPDSVENIGNYVFMDCQNLVDVTISEGITEISDGMFWLCNSLVNITIPDSITRIGSDAFRECSSLTNIVIPDSVLYIGYSAFYNCTELQKVYIPKSTERILNEAFYLCPKLNIYYAGSIADFGKFTNTSAFDSFENLYLNHAHSYTSTITKKATCKEEGVKTFTCSCGDTYTEIIPKTEHTWNENGGVPATCEQGGIRFTYCEVCGEQKDSVTLPATGHSFGEWVVIKEPIETEKGLKESTCANCGKKKTEEIPCLPQRVQDEQSGIAIDAPSGSYDGKLEMNVEEQFDGESFQIINGLDGVSQSKVYDITTTVGGEKVQPGVPVTVRIPLPEGYNPERTFVYHINSETGEVENMNARVENGYLVFETDHFSIYAVVEEAEPEKDYGVIGNILKVVVDFVVKVVCIAFEFIKDLWNAIF